MSHWATNSLHAFPGNYWCYEPAIATPAFVLPTALTGQIQIRNGTATYTAAPAAPVRRLMQDLADDSPFYQLHRHFMYKVLAPAVGRPLSYSSHPKMRVHLPDTPSVSSFHSDVPVTRRIDQVNFWMPFTDVDDTAARAPRPRAEGVDLINRLATRHGRG